MDRLTQSAGRAGGVARAGMQRARIRSLIASAIALSDQAETEAHHYAHYLSQLDGKSVPSALAEAFNQSFNDFWLGQMGDAPAEAKRQVVGWLDGFIHGVLLNPGEFLGAVTSDQLREWLAAHLSHIADVE